MEKATKVARRTVERIQQVGKKQIQANISPIFKSPRKVVQWKKTVSELDSFDLVALRRTVNNFHIVHKGCVTIKKLLLEIKSSGIGFNGGDTTLRGILHKMGF